jgi:hypothetical protein
MSTASTMKQILDSGLRDHALLELRVRLLCDAEVFEYDLKRLLPSKYWREYQSRVMRGHMVAADARADYVRQLRRYLERLKAADALAARAERSSTDAPRALSFNRPPTPRKLSHLAQAEYEHAVEALSELLPENPGLVAAFDRSIEFDAQWGIEIFGNQEDVPRLSWSRSPHVRRRLHFEANHLRAIQLEVVSAAQLELFARSTRRALNPARSGALPLLDQLPDRLSVGHLTPCR